MSVGTDSRSATRSELAVHGVRVDAPVRRSRTARARATTGTCSSTVPTPRCPSTPTAPTGAGRPGLARRRPTPGCPSKPVRRPRFYDLTTADGDAVRADRPAARRGRAGHHRRPDLHPVRRGRPLPVLHDRGVAALRRHDRGQDPGPARRGRRGGGPARRRAADGDDHRHHHRPGPRRPQPGPLGAGGPRRGAGPADPGADRAAGRPVGDRRSSRARAPPRSASTSSRWTTRSAAGGCRARPLSDGRVRGRLGRGGPSVRPQPGLHVPARRSRRGPGRTGRGRGAVDRAWRVSVRRAVPADAGHTGRGRRGQTAAARGCPGRHRAGGRAAERGRDARRRPGGGLRGLWCVQRAVGGRRHEYAHGPDHRCSARGGRPCAPGSIRRAGFPDRAGRRRGELAAYRALRRQAFVERAGSVRPTRPRRARRRSAHDRPGGSRCRRHGDRRGAARPGR